MSSRAGRRILSESSSKYAFEAIDVRVVWEGRGEAERGIDAETGRVLVEIDPRYYRPAEVELLQGDARKAEVKFGWKAETDVRSLAKIMVEYDLRCDSYGGRE